MNQAETPIPTRARPFEKAQKPTPAWLKAILGRELSPSRSEYQAVTQALWEGDPAMEFQFCSHVGAPDAGGRIASRGDNSREAWTTPAGSPNSR